MSDVAAVTSHARPWAKLLTLSIVCACCSGLLPGASLFVDMFAQAGVLSSVCGDESRCLKQSMLLSTSFSLGQSLMLCFNLPIGLLFDMHGARPLGVWGAALVLVGLLTLQLPLLGADRGIDSVTWYVLPISVMLADVGAFTNSNCLSGLLWHFPGMQMLVISLGVASYQIASLTPIVLRQGMLFFNVSFEVAMAPLTLVVALCVFLCQRLTPTQQDFYKAAKQVLGMPLPSPPESFRICTMIQRSNEVLKRDWLGHALFVFTVGVGYSFVFMYQGLASDYGSELFDDKVAGERLAWWFVLLNGLLGGIVAPACCVFVDRIKIEWLAVVILLCIVCELACSTLASWSAQIATSCAVVMTNAVFQAFIAKYVLAFAPPNRFGTVNGMLWCYMMALAIPFFIGWSMLLDSLPSGVERYKHVYLAQSILGLLTFGCFTLYLFVVGLPALPVFLAEDEAEIAKSFGCKDFESLLYVMHIDKREKLCKLLSSTDLDIMTSLTKSIDMERLGEKLAELGNDELGAILESVDDQVSDDSDEERIVLPNTIATPSLVSHLPLVHSAPASLMKIGTPCKQTSSTSFIAWIWGTCSISWKGVAKLFGSICTRLCSHHRWRRIGDSAADPTMELDLHQITCETDISMSQLSKRLISCISERDKRQLVDMILTLPVDDIWQSQLELEHLLSDREYNAVEKQFDRLIPGKEWAKLLKERRELRTLASRMIKRRLMKGVSS